MWFLKIKYHEKKNYFFFNPYFFCFIVGLYIQCRKKYLIKLYQQTGGEQWKANRDLSTPVETWYGVRIQNNKVVSIQKN
jgi:hypothetical protein